MAQVSGVPPSRLPDTLSCAMATILPSLPAPMRMCWIVAVRCVVLFGMSARCSCTFTGRPAARAASAAITTSARRKSLPPKPPPMYGDITCTFSLGIRSVFARSPTAQFTIWFAVQQRRVETALRELAGVFVRDDGDHARRGFRLGSVDRCDTALADRGAHDVADGGIGNHVLAVVGVRRGTRGLQRAVDAIGGL